MAKKFIDDLKVGDVIKRDGYYLICKEKEVSSPEDTCNGCQFLRWGGCIKPSDLTSCSFIGRSDGKSVIFQVIDNDKGLPLVKDIEVLERLSKEYPGKNLDNIIMPIRARFKELNK